MLKNNDGSFTIEEADLATDTDAEIVIPENADEKLKQDLQTTIAKKKAWREKAIDPSTQKSYKELYESIKTQKPIDTTTKKETVEVSDDIRKDITSLKEESSKRIFQHANKLSPEQVDEIFGYAKGMGIEPKVALEKPFMKKLLDQMTSDEEASNASLPPSRRAPAQVGGKTFAQMTPEERKTNFPSIAKSR
jgi:hypothetical protein